MSNTVTIYHNPPLQQEPGRARTRARPGEAEFKENFKDREMSEAHWIAALVAHPVLIERPIVVAGNRAVVGRPPEKILEIL